MNEIINAKWSSDMDLDGVFAELGDECKIAIERKEPEWCSGHIRTIYFDPKEPISLDWIQKKFGGEKMQVRLHGPKSPQNKSGYIGSRTIEIMGPPRDGHGIELVQGPDGKAVKVTELELAMERHSRKMGLQKTIAETPPPPAIPAASESSLVQVLIESQSRQHNAMLEMMGTRVKSLEEMLYHQPKQQQQQAGPTQNPMEHLKQTFEAMQLLETMRNKLGGGGGGDTDSMESLFPMIGQVLQGLLGNKLGKTAPTQQVSGLKPPTKVRRPVPLPQKIPAEGEPVTLSGIADNLSRLSAEDAAECVLSAMGNMPAEKRMETFQYFVADAPDMSELDESTVGLDNNSQDDETQEDPFSVTQNIPVPVPGKPAGPNAPDNQTDRPGDKKGLTVLTD